MLGKSAIENSDACDDKVSHITMVNDLPSEETFIFILFMFTTVTKMETVALETIVDKDVRHQFKEVLLIG